MKKTNFGWLLLVAMFLTVPAQAEQVAKRHHKSHHAVKHHSAHVKKVAYKRTAHKAKNVQTDTPASGEVYTVKPGDVFGKICQKYQPAGVSLKKVMQEVYAVNKKAFVNGDQKRLIVGSKLRIPAHLVPSRVVEAKKAETVQATKAKEAVPAKKADSAAKAVTRLEDDPKNPASQIKLPEPAAATSPTAVPSQANDLQNPVRAAPPAPAPEIVTSTVIAPPMEAAGEIPAEQKAPIQARRDTGLNGLILFVAIGIALAVFIYLKVRSRKIEKAQQELINQLMSKSDNENF